MPNCICFIQIHEASICSPDNSFDSLKVTWFPQEVVMFLKNIQISVAWIGNINKAFLSYEWLLQHLRASSAAVTRRNCVYW